MGGVVGKSRRHKHVDRTAHRDVIPGRTTKKRTGKAADRRTKVAMHKPVAATTGMPPAIPLSVEFEPHALGSNAASGSQSRYPAKKARRTRPAKPAPLVVATPAREADAGVATVAAPILLLGYSPLAVVAQPDIATASSEKPSPFNLDAWADDVLGALVARPVFDTPSPAMVRAASAPLPRRSTVILWRNNGPLQAITRWVRTNAWRLAVRIAPKSPPKTNEVVRLRAENEALRRQLMALQQMPA